MSDAYLGFDTSNYTTSAALFIPDKREMKSLGRLLPVPEGAKGLRQSDALFHHVKELWEVASPLAGSGEIKCVAAATRPRDAEGSYMPCFLAGENAARLLAGFLGASFRGFSHQAGHIAAAVWSAGRTDLLFTPFLAWHVSGGTTELLYISPGDGQTPVKAEPAGGTLDIAAGQAIDRAGVALGLRFPCGQELDRLSLSGSGSGYKPGVKDSRFNLSGLENMAKKLISENEKPENIARFVVGVLAAALCEATEQAYDKYGRLPLLCCGGVMSNTLLRAEMSARFGAVFGEPEFSRDNAAGIAYLGYFAGKLGEG